MIDPEPLIVSGLDRLVPLPSGERADWQDVLGRAGETRRRRLGVPHPGTWSRLQIAVAVIVVGLMLAAAATATYIVIERASANQALLERGGPVHRSGHNGPVKLLPGRVTTDALGMKASFEVFDHWYGEQEPGELSLGKHLTTGEYEVDLARGGVEVTTLDSPLARTARRLETLPGIRIDDVSPVRLGRHSGRRYSFHLDHYLTFRGCCGLGAWEHDVILLGVGHRTLVIQKVLNRVDADDDQVRGEAEQVIQSFRVHS